MSDFISRQDAIDAMATWDWQETYLPIHFKQLLEELPPAQLANEWIPFKKRPLTEEEEEMYPDWIFMMDCDTPEDGEEILVSNGKFVWADTWYSGDFCCLDSDHELDGCAWMRFPDPWKGGTE